MSGPWSVTILGGLLATVVGRVIVALIVNALNTGNTPATKSTSSADHPAHANSTGTCAKPGSGSGECGAGIPAGTRLAFTLIYNITGTPIQQQTADLASDAKQAGIKLSLSASNFNFMIQNYNDTVSPANENEWAMEDFGGETDATYPTQFGFLNTGGGGQLGDYSNPRADALINQSISGRNRAAVTNEASFFTTQLPVLWQPVPDYVWAWKSNVSATTPAAIENLTQYDDTPQFWYLTK